MEKHLEKAKKLFRGIPVWTKYTLAALCAVCAFLLVLLLLTGARLENSDSAVAAAHSRIKGSLQTEVNSLYRSYEKLSLDKYDNESEVLPEMRILLHGIELLNANIEGGFAETVIPSNALTAVSSTLDTLNALLKNKNDISKAVSQLGSYLDQIREITG